MNNRLFLLSLILLFTIPVLAQEHDDHHHDEHSHHQIHEHKHVHEIGVSVAPIYFIRAEELSIATHIHYVYNFPQTKFGIGLGYERVFDEHKHNFVGVELNYRPVHRLTLNLSPGVAFEGDHTDHKEFALHFETVYEFEFGVFHLGPMLEMAYHPEDVHISLGIHIGLGL